jgi:hypothetical protein
MKKIYLPSTGADDWRRLLADPGKHWETGFSAKALAHCWEHADKSPSGLPLEIANLLRTGDSEPALLLALPEHKVYLPGSELGASQNDIFALIRVGPRTIAATIEGKVEEPFGPQLGDWMVDASPGKRERLAYLCKVLGLEQRALPHDLHYQLLHRTASAVIEAERFKTDTAAMLVHSFSPTSRWFDAFAHFASLFGCKAEPGKLMAVRPNGLRPLHLGWARGDPQFLTV